MKRREILAAAAFGPAAWSAAGAAPALPGEAVRWPEVDLLDGARWSAAQASGKAVVVVFWSTTCPFCKRHNQHVEKLQRAAAGKALSVLGVARDRDPATVRRTIAAQGYSFANTLDYAPMSAALSTRNMIPLTVTVDRQGRLKHVLPGEMFEEDVLELLQLAG